ncbi:hypothetical protein [Streptomyces sp. RFCAC02]|uniref:hypothetical protein n=1 Tax=Streptomyces sp. RFCAC02 TaxID=2499143 RepID=UPI00102006C6|nr:hypothetical protein [Streptomyces sp. RFCAC02]
MTPRVRAHEADGTVWDDPSGDRLHDLIADLNLRFDFLIVERLDLEPADQHYIQVRLNEDLSHTVEYREGGPDAHWTADLPHRDDPWGVEPVADVVTSWAAEGDEAWRGALPWRKWREGPEG